MEKSEKLKKHMRRRLTLMLIPHSDFRPLQINISLALLVFMALAWSGMTVWSGYIASRHVDYWRTKADEQILRAKVWYFAQELKRSREYLDHVKETEVALQHLLNMKNRKAIIEADHAMGGPESRDQKQLSRLLSGHPNFEVRDVADQLEGVQREGQSVIASFEEISSYVKEQHDIFRAKPLKWPTEGRLTSFFGVRKSPLDDWQEHEFHRGIDIANEMGTPVRVTADGVVHIASWQGGYGRLVIVDHAHGYRTYYGHNSELLVKPGDVVKRGQMIARMGTSGHSTGYHLHYEVWKDGRAVNPMQFVKATD